MLTLPTLTRKLEIKLVIQVDKCAGACEMKSVIDYIYKGKESLLNLMENSFCDSSRFLFKIHRTK